MTIGNDNARDGWKHAEQQMRQWVLLTFCDPVAPECWGLERLSGREWRRLLRWLDTSGLALYFLDRIHELNRTEVLPIWVQARLRQNLADNRERTEALITEMRELDNAFRSKAVSYAVLKGFSLYPLSVPRPELRSQLDLDFLVADECATEAKATLEGRGYRLRAVSGRTWEFKAHAGAAAGSLVDLYKATPFRSVEVHFEDTHNERNSKLGRTELRSFRDMSLPMLDGPDLLLGQGMHLFKHICSEFSRTAHVVEFRRHVLARAEDDVFWRELERRAGQDARLSFGLGLVICLITELMGEFAPKVLTRWTADRLPETARLWVRCYGQRSVLGSFPGSKVYLLLQGELEKAGIGRRRSTRAALLPRRLPPAMACAEKDESVARRMMRYRRQAMFIGFRLRFHVVEGLRYLCESAHWKRQLRTLGS
jgi:hypothetical protein